MGTDRIDWREDALCSKGRDEQHRAAGVDVSSDDFFHVDLSNEPGRRHVARVLAICNVCPVLAECRNYVLTEDPDPRWAIIGGLIPTEIKRLKRGAA